MANKKYLDAQGVTYLWSKVKGEDAKKINGLTTGVTEDNLIAWGSNGTTVKDAGMSVSQFSAIATAVSQNAENASTYASNASSYAKNSSSSASLASTVASNVVATVGQTATAENAVSLSATYLNQASSNASNAKSITTSYSVFLIYSSKNSELLLFSSPATLNT